eukprot:jgi/Botrbrau1/7284/Bobra.0318s0020.1
MESHGEDDAFYHVDPRITELSPELAFQVLEAAEASGSEEAFEGGADSYFLELADEELGFVEDVAFDGTEDEDNEDDDEDHPQHFEINLQQLQNAINFHHASRDWDAQEPQPRRDTLLQSFDLAGVADFIKAGKARNIVCMVGAGISVNAGIPDFRSPNTGLYARLAAYGLPPPGSNFRAGIFSGAP